jgi:hypothetical protein
MCGSRAMTANPLSVLLNKEESTPDCTVEVEKTKKEQIKQSYNLYTFSSNKVLKSSINDCIKSKAILIKKKAAV